MPVGAGGFALSGFGVRVREYSPSNSWVAAMPSMIEWCIFST